MASERELRNRMRQLEQQLAQQESQQANLRRQIEAQTQQQIADMQRRTEETFRRRMNETAEEYARRVRQFQEEILRRNEQQLRQLRQESEELNRRTRQTLKELEQCNKELREELKKLRDDASRQTAEGRRIAAEACQRAEAARTTAAQTPHDFCCPQEFEIISEHIADIEPLIKQGMYQAAISDGAVVIAHGQDFVSRWNLSCFAPRSIRPFPNGCRPLRITAESSGISMRRFRPSRNASCRPPQAPSA